jgi:hypothetical protein
VRGVGAAILRLGEVLRYEYLVAGVTAGAAGAPDGVMSSIAGIEEVVETDGVVPATAGVAGGVEATKVSPSFT